MQALEGPDQLCILGLGLVDQDVDADRARVHRVDRAQRLGEHVPVERRALAELLQRLVIVGDEDDPVVLLEHALRRPVEAPVVERPLGVAGERDVGVEAGEVEAGGEEQDGGEQPDRADLADRPPQPLPAAAFRLGHPIPR